MMRVTTLKLGAGGASALAAYYVGLAADEPPGADPVGYYVDTEEPPGRWWGPGCEAVGLEGEVERGQLEAMFDARHPTTGDKVGRAFGAKSARGFDATFSVP